MAVEALVFGKVQTVRFVPRHDLRNFMQHHRAVLYEAASLPMPSPHLAQHKDAFGGVLEEGHDGVRPHVRVQGDGVRAELLTRDTAVAWHQKTNAAGRQQAAPVRLKNRPRPNTAHSPASPRELAREESSRHPSDSAWGSNRECEWVREAVVR